jgi:cysteine desulfurase
MNRVYLDNSASTPVDRQVMSLYVDNYVDNFGNPSSVHSFGQKARADIERARLVFADVLDCSSQEIIFCGSATEANNIAISGVIASALSSQARSGIQNNNVFVGNSIPSQDGIENEAIKNTFSVNELGKQEKQNDHGFQIESGMSKPLESNKKLSFESIISTSMDSMIKKPHVLFSSIEHASVADFVHHPDADVETFGVLPNGVADLEDLFSKIRPETVLISLMLVNNEIGTIQPVQKLAKRLQILNQNREHKILLHCDGVQSVLWMKLNLRESGFDFFTLSSHKIYAPKGAAVLYIKKDVAVSKTIFGGSQEKGLRSGTQNTQAIVAFAEAMKIAQSDMSADTENVAKLQTYILDFVTKNIPNAILNGDKVLRTPNNIHFTFPDFDQDILLTKLDLAGFAVSAGSSCSSGANEPSHIPKLLHPDTTGADLRVTLGKQNTMEEVVAFCMQLKEILI